MIIDAKSVGLERTAARILTTALKRHARTEQSAMVLASPVVILIKDFPVGKDELRRWEL